MSVEKHDPTTDYPDDYKGFPGFTTKNGWHNGTILGCVRADDLEILEHFLKYIKICSYTCCDRYRYDDKDVDLNEAFRDAIIHNKIDAVKLFIKYNHKLPEDSLKIWSQNFYLDKNSSDVLKIVLNHCGYKQVTREIIEQATSHGSYEFDLDEILDRNKYAHMGMYFKIIIDDLLNAFVKKITKSLNFLTPENSCQHTVYTVNKIE